VTGAGPGLSLTVVAAAAGGLAAVGAREAVLATPAVAAWVQAALEPLRRAGREGYLPSVPERRRLAGLLAGLPARERELLALKYGAGATNRAIARLTGLSESNVGTILHRTIESLRTAWDEGGRP